MPPKTFGQLVAEKRAALHLSQSALAAQAGLSIKLVQAIEQGTRKNNTQDTMCRLAAVLGFTPEELGRAICPSLPQAA